MRAMGQNPTEDEVFFHDRGHYDDGDHSDHGGDYELDDDGPESRVAKCQFFYTDHLCPTKFTPRKSA